MTIHPNAPAMPGGLHATEHHFGQPPYEPGLTIRAELAARAMQGLLANPTILNLASNFTAHPKAIAIEAIVCADALIAALNESEARK